MRVNRICPSCEKEFTTFFSSSRFTSGRGKYCSVACRGLARRAQPIKRRCRSCGKEFDIIPRLLRISKGWYCSSPCFGASRRGKETIPFGERLASWISFPINEDDCATWIGCPAKGGYGKISKLVNGKVKDMRAHRAVYELYFGSLDPTVNVLHSCDNPPCCNIHHLFTGSHADNIRDKVSKDRQAMGEKNNHAKLTTEQVIKIKRLIKQGLYLVDIAARYGVTVTAISAIKLGKTWKHIPFQASSGRE